MQIDDNIPPPPRRTFKGKGGHKSRYPFREMAIGQSVFYPGENKVTSQHPAYMVAKGIQKRDGLVFSLRSEIKDGQAGIRIWRVA